MLFSTGKLRHSQGEIQRMYRGERLFNFLPLYVGEPLKRPPELPPRHMTNIYPPCNLGNYIQFSILRCRKKEGIYSEQAQSRRDR